MNTHERAHEYLLAMLHGGEWSKASDAVVDFVQRLAASDQLSEDELKELSQQADERAVKMLVDTAYLIAANVEKRLHPDSEDDGDE